MDGEFIISKWTGVKVLLNQRICRIDENPIFINRDYLLYSISKKLKEIEDKTPCTTVKHLSSKKIEEIAIMMPPISIQNQFAEFVERIDKSKLNNRV
jgi:type I restriction enzyme S subunit